MSHLAPRTATQVLYPWKAAARTAIQAFLAFVGLLLAALAIPEVRTFGETYLPPSWFAWILGAAAFLSALAGILAKVMALAQFNEFLTRIGLGATPAIDAGTADPNRPSTITGL